MVITDSFHNDIEGKDYKYGSPTMIDDKSKPIILYYFLDDYERAWDEGKPITYDDEELKNNASVSLIDYTDNVLLINLFDYESFDETSLKFEVGKETSIPDVVDENDHSKEYKFTPTKIVVANGLEKDTAVFNEIVSSVWEGYYSRQQEGGKLPKVAENVEGRFYDNLEEKIQAKEKEIEDFKEYMDKVAYGRPELMELDSLEQELAELKNTHFGAESHSYKKCAECSDSVFGLEEEICFECSSFGAEYEKTDDERILGIENGNGKRVGTVSIEDVSGNKDKVFISIDGYNEEDEHGFHPMIWDGVIPESPFMAETYEAQGKPTWAGYCPFCKKWRTTEWSKKYGGDTVCAKGIPDPHYRSGEEALFGRENFARKGGKWIRPKENICGVVLEKKQSKNAESFNADVKMDNRAWVAYYEYDFANVRPENPENITGDSKMVSFRDYRKELYGIYLTTQEAKKAFNLLKGSLMGHGDWKDGQYQQVINGYKQIYGGTSLKKTIPMQMKFEYVPIRRFGYDTAMHTKSKNAETFEANAKTGNKVYIITRRCEDYSAYRELDMAVFSSLTEARKKFNYLFKQEKEYNYPDETIADAKNYMRWDDVGWGLNTFMADDMLYELREQTIGNNAMSGFSFDAEEVPKEIRKELYITNQYERFPKWKREEIDNCKHKIIINGYGMFSEEPNYECEKCNCPFVIGLKGE